jgi:hypothetical protein
MQVDMARLGRRGAQTHLGNIAPKPASVGRRSAALALQQAAQGAPGKPEVRCPLGLAPATCSCNARLHARQLCSLDGCAHALLLQLLAGVQLQLTAVFLKRFP